MKFYNNIKIDFLNLKKAIDEIHGLQGVEYVTALPDSKSVKNIETPKSIVVVLKDYIIPELLTDSINCSISLARIGITPEQLLSKKTEIINNLIHLLKTSPLKLDRATLTDILMNGPSSITKYLDIETSELSAYENFGKSTLDDLIIEELDIDQVLPKRILNNKIFSELPGIYFQGTHFIEFSKMVKHISLTDVSDKIMLSDHTYVTFHFDHPISREINHLYSNRQNSNSSIFANIRNYLFHKNAQKSYSTSNLYKYLFSKSKFTSIPLKSIEGQRYLTALKFAINHGNTAHLVMSNFILQAIELTFNQAIDYKFVSHVSHADYRYETILDRKYLVLRKNAGKSLPNGIGLISGYYNSPSLVLKGRTSSNKNLSWLSSFDHGMGNHLYKQNDNKSELNTVTVYRMKSKNPNLRIWMEKVYFSDLVSDFIDYYNEADSSAFPVALLSPIINFKEQKKRTIKQSLRYLISVSYRIIKLVLRQLKHINKNNQRTIIRYFKPSEIYDYAGRSFNKSSITNPLIYIMNTYLNKGYQEASNLLLNYQTGYNPLNLHEIFFSNIKYTSLQKFDLMSEPYLLPWVPETVIREFPITYKPQLIKGPYKTKFEIKRITSIVDSIRSLGFDSSFEGYPKGIIIERNGIQKFIVLSGHHRVAAMSVLNFESIPVARYCIQKINYPSIINCDNLSSLPVVKSGIMSENEAAMILSLFFE